MDVDSRPRLTRRDQRLVQCLTVERFAHGGKARLADMAQTTDSVADPLSVGGTDVPDSDSGIDIHTTAGKLADLERRVDEAVHAGSERAVEKQHARGKKTARERIEMLLDAGSFVELDELARHRSTNFGQEANRPYGDGVVTGYGTVDGRPVASSRRTSPSSAGRSARSSARRSSR